MIIDTLKWIALALLVSGIIGGLVMWSRFGAGSNDDGGQ
jgi:hypothetical protein